MTHFSELSSSQIFNRISFSYYMKNASKHYQSFNLDGFHVRMFFLVSSCWFGHFGKGSCENEYEMLQHVYEIVCAPPQQIALLVSKKWLWPCLALHLGIESSLHWLANRHASANGPIWYCTMNKLKLFLLTFILYRFFKNFSTSSNCKNWEEQYLYDFSIRPGPNLYKSRYTNSWQHSKDQRTIFKSDTAKSLLFR